MKLIFLFLSLVLFAGCDTSAKSQLSSDGEVLYSCRITSLDRDVFESFGDGVELNAFDRRVDHPQWDAFVKVLVTAQRSLNLALGERTYRNAERLNVSSDSILAYTVESPDVEIGYLLRIQAFGDLSATLSGFTTDLRPGESPEDRAEDFAKLVCFYMPDVG